MDRSGQHDGQFPPATYVPLIPGQLPEEWRWEDVISESDLHRELIHPIMEAMAVRRGYESWDAYEKANVGKEAQVRFNAMHTEHNGLFSALSEALQHSEGVTTYVPVPPKQVDPWVPPDPMMGFRIKPGIFFGVRESVLAIGTLTVSVWALCQAGALGPGEVESSAAIALAFHRIYSALQRLEGDEKLVFEAVHSFRRIYRKVNFDLPETDSRAYGREWPTEIDLQTELGDSLCGTRLLVTLEALQRANLIVKSGSRYRIAF